MEKKKLIIISCIPIILTCLIIILFGPRYHIVDDLLINYILEGVYGKGMNQYIILPYLSVVFTFPIYLIELILPNMNIYLVSLYFYMTVAFIGLNILFYKKYQQIWLQCLLWILQLILLQYLTYTVVAYMICFVGLLYLFDNTSRIFKIIGLCCIGFGISIRKDIFLSLLILCFPLIVYSFIKNKKITIIHFVLCFCIYFGICGIDSYIASKNFKVQSYLQWNDICTQVRDFPMISYEDYDEEFIKNDISYNDFECIYSWIFVEKQSLGEEQLQILSQQRSFFQKYEINPIQIAITFFSEPMYIMYSLFAIIILMMYKWKNYLGLGIVFCTMGDLAALILRQRVVERVYIPLMICGVLLLLYEKKDTFKNRRLQFDTVIQISSFLWLTSMLIYGLNFKNWFVFHQDKPMSQTYQYAQSHSEDLLIFDGYRQLIKAQYPIDLFMYDDSQFNKNLMTLGNWDTFSIRYYEQMKNFDIDQPDYFLEHVHEYDHVKFIMYPDSPKKSLIQKWYLEHKNVNIQFHVIDYIGKMEVMEVKVKSYDE